MAVILAGLPVSDHALLRVIGRLVKAFESQPNDVKKVNERFNGIRAGKPPMRLRAGAVELADD